MFSIYARGIAAACIATVATATAALSQTYVAPYDYPQPEGSDAFVAVIEIPAGGMTKYEIDADTGLTFVDRYMSMPVVYPVNYGSITSSIAADGDPLDVLVYTREPVSPGALIRVRPIGVLKMVDGGDADDKIVAVPVSDVDPTYDAIKSAEDLPAVERQRLEAFFRVYKQLPEGGGPVEMGGYESADAANKAISDALAKYKAEKK